MENQSLANGITRHGLDLARHMSYGICGGLLMFAFSKVLSNVGRMCKRHLKRIRMR